MFDSLHFEWFKPENSYTVLLRFSLTDFSICNQKYINQQQHSRGDLDVYFPPFNNGSHCSYYTEALSLASPLVLQLYPCVSSVHSLESNSAPVDWPIRMTHSPQIRSHITRFVCVLLCLCTRRVPSGALVDFGEVDFLMYMCVCVPDISTVCFLCAQRSDHPNGEDTQVVPTARPFQSAWSDTNAHMHYQGLR